MAFVTPMEVIAPITIAPDLEGSIIQGCEFQQVLWKVEGAIEFYIDAD